MKAFLGMGLLGSNFVQAMIKRGDKVQVWNRTLARATAVEAFGAKAFAAVEEAVAGAEIVHVALRDDASVDEVLKNAKPGLAPGTIIVDHTTTSKEGAIRRTKDWAEQGFRYQHAPVFMGPANALEASGYMLISGEPQLVETLRPILSKMTGHLLHFGTEPGKAAAMKLVGNAFLICYITGIRDTLALSKTLGVEVDELGNLFNSWNPGAQLPARLSRMANGDYSTPSWELQMARKDVQLFLDAAANGEGRKPVLLPAAAELMDEWIGKGFGSSDWNVIAKDCL